MRNYTKTYTKNCAECKNDFTTKCITTMYCSAKCKYIRDKRENKSSYRRVGKIGSCKLCHRDYVVENYKQRKCNECLQHGFTTKCNRCRREFTVTELRRKICFKCDYRYTPRILAKSVEPPKTGKANLEHELEKQKQAISHAVQRYQQREYSNYNTTYF